MARRSFLVDEHVLRVFTLVLRSNGFEVTTVQERYGQQSVDARILEECGERCVVVITNDRDFVRLTDDIDHAGILMYTDRSLLLESPVTAVRAIDDLTGYYSAGELRNVVEWLENWV